MGVHYTNYQKLLPYLADRYILKWIYPPQEHIMSGTGINGSGTIYERTLKSGGIGHQSMVTIRYYHHLRVWELGFESWVLGGRIIWEPRVKRAPTHKVGCMVVCGWETLFLVYHFKTNHSVCTNHSRITCTCLLLSSHPRAFHTYLKIDRNLGDLGSSLELHSQLNHNGFSNGGWVH